MHSIYRDETNCRSGTGFWVPDAHCALSLGKENAAVGSYLEHIGSRHVLHQNNLFEGTLRWRCRAGIRYRREGILFWRDTFRILWSSGCTGCILLLCDVIPDGAAC